MKPMISSQIWRSLLLLWCSLHFSASEETECATESALPRALGFSTNAFLEYTTLVASDELQSLVVAGTVGSTSSGGIMYWPTILDDIASSGTKDDEFTEDVFLHLIPMSAYEKAAMFLFDYTKGNAGQYKTGLIRPSGLTTVEFSGSTDRD